MISRNTLLSVVFLFVSTKVSALDVFVRPVSTIQNVSKTQISSAIEKAKKNKPQIDFGNYDNLISAINQSMKMDLGDIHISPLQGECPKGAWLIEYAPTKLVLSNGRSELTLSYRLVRPDKPDIQFPGTATWCGRLGDYIMVPTPSSLTKLQAKIVASRVVSCLVKLAPVGKIGDNLSLTVRNETEANIGIEFGFLATSTKTKRTTLVKTPDYKIKSIDPGVSVTRKYPIPDFSLSAGMNVGGEKKVSKEPFSDFSAEILSVDFN